MKIGQRRGKGSKLYVQPAELARKLVKEMEDHKVPRSGRVLVRNRYTIFLCPDDYRRFRDRTDVLAERLERHLAKYVKAKKYDLAGELSVIIDVDPDLSLGYFGILAERDAVMPVEVMGATGPGDLTGRPVGAAGPAGAVARPAGAAGPARAGSPKGAASPNGAAATAGPVPPAAGKLSSSTAVLSATEASRLGLARQTIVIRAGTREEEFTQGQVLIGRAKEADFRIDDPEVSRRHAMVLWSGGELVIRDLDSTNGTMVNGRPVTSAVVRPGDQVMIGGHRLVIEAR